MNQILNDFRIRLNELGKQKTPFFFLIDFEKKKPFVCELDQLAKENIYLKTKDFSNFIPQKIQIENDFKIQAVSFPSYLKAIEYVIEQINYGNSYLVNLTFPTIVDTKYDLATIFKAAEAPYKLFFKNRFVSFSPETFIKINENTIFSFPMKGTINAAIPNAKNIILKDEKEKSEHYTIVDLIRNDLSMVAKQVEVSRFRYIDEIKTNHKHLYQVSSEIKGKMDENWNEKIGDILLTLLPAGSVSGAPKKKTMEIIANAEKDKRGYYTGIFGIFDGENIDSAVNIRYMEKEASGKLIYRSGGGITAMSNPKQEYNELIDKIYVPVDGNH